MSASSNGVDRNTGSNDAVGVRRHTGQRPDSYQPRVQRSEALGSSRLRIPTGFRPPAQGWIGQGDGGPSQPWVTAANDPKP